MQLPMIWIQVSKTGRHCHASERTQGSGTSAHYGLTIGLKISSRFQMVIRQAHGGLFDPPKGMKDVADRRMFSRMPVCHMNSEKVNQLLSLKSKGCKWRICQILCYLANAKRTLKLNFFKFCSQTSLFLTIQANQWPLSSNNVEVWQCSPSEETAVLFHRRTIWCRVQSSSVSSMIFTLIGRQKVSYHSAH